MAQTDAADSAGQGDVLPDQVGSPDGGPDSVRPDEDGGGGPDVPDGSDVPPIPPDVPDAEPSDAPDAVDDSDGGCTSPAQCQHLIEPDELCREAFCEGGACITRPKSCAETPDNLCTIDICNPDSGACEHQANPDCGCLNDEDCPQDTNLCTRPHCEIPGGAEFGTCAFVAETGGCDDNDPCTEAERCQPHAALVAVCGGGNPRSCDDEDGGTFDFCDSAVHVGDPCQNVPSTPCPNGQGDCPESRACVTFTCDGVAGNPVCQPASRTGSCSDGNFCTTTDMCEASRCVGGAARTCDDDDAATHDSCNPFAAACDFAPIDNPPCVTAADCTAQLGAAGPCRERLCVTGTCRHVSLPNETSCEDGLYCTIDDSCRQGECVGGAVRDCDDGNPLTGACTCNETTKECDCPPSPPICGTGCQSGTDCNDGDPCTTDSCIRFVSPSVCTCEPRRACHCTPGGDPAECDDLQDSTIDACVGPEHPAFPEGWPYDGYCTHDVGCTEPCSGDGDDATCDDGSKCTLDVCELFNEAEGTFCCVHPQMSPPTCFACVTDGDCADSFSCTTDHCGADGRCDPPQPIAGCEECFSDESCEEDDNPCTTARCVDHECVLQNNNAACQDNDACTINDVCDGGVCAGEERVCDDHNPCTRDTCDPVQGCLTVFIDPPVLPECDDCRTQPGRCNDYNECTDDVCTATGVCENVDPNSTAATPACQAIACRDEVDCDDGNPCTRDECRQPQADPDGDGPIVPVGGCRYFERLECPVLEVLRCDTAADCDPLECVTDEPAAFCHNPSEVCPATYCDPVVGCRFPPTVGCPLFECQPQTAHQACWDQSPCTVDECDPLTLQCVPPEERRSASPADNLYSLCEACETAADCPERGSFDRNDPCITVECLKPAQPYVDGEGNVDPAGVCYAYVDPELFPNACEDYDLCTVDACVRDVGCSHELRVADCEPCFGDADCDDLDGCTADACVTLEGGYRSCTHTPEEECVPCSVHADCRSLYTACEWFFCNGGRCAAMPFRDAPPVPYCIADAGCTLAAECDDGLPETQSVCWPEFGSCIFAPVPGACGDVSHCFTLDPCQRAVSCTAGQCVMETIPGCAPQACTTDGPCDDGDPCTDDICLGVCVHLAASGTGCCDSLAECPLMEDEPPCHVPSCGPDHTCHRVPFRDSARCGDVCTEDADCARFFVNEVEVDWPCSRGACGVDGRCVHFDGDCTACADADDCADPDPCTVDTCSDGACVHTPDPACAPVACDADMPCDSGDACTIGLCLSGTCVWLPSPLCR